MAKHFSPKTFGLPYRNSSSGLPSIAEGRPTAHQGHAALRGILFVLRTGIPWEYLSRELGCGSGMTCWRRAVSRLAAFPIA